MLVISIYLFFNVATQVYESVDLRRQEEIVQKELTALQEENAQLTAEKTKLEDPNYVATYARGEYMFSKDDEKVFYLPEYTSQSEE